MNEPKAALTEIPAQHAGRLVFDLTTSALWSGPPAGIVRVEREFGRWALAHLDTIAPAFFDSATASFRHLSRDIAERLILRDVALDTLSFVNPARHGRRKSDRIPRSLRPAALWVLQWRRKTLQALERMRLRTAPSAVAALLDKIQRTLMNAKDREAMVKPDGTRRTYLPIATVLGAAVEFTARDTLICCGVTWTHTDIAAIVAAKYRFRFRFVLACHDLIPLMFPQFYEASVVAAHERFWTRALPAADVLVCFSRTVEADVRAYCATHGLTLDETAVCCLGANISTPAVRQALPEGLEAGRYALLVGTIEPRKGHRLIYEAWRQLLVEGVPQRMGFKLVFAGREGWMTGELMGHLRTEAQSGGTIALLTQTDDALMATLYENAAFCLFPSRYEGFGLPVIEAFFHGKAVLASTGGAVPEAAGDFSPCLDPEDAAAWAAMLRRWIEEPRARAVYEERIRSSFRHPTWDQCAAMFFERLSKA
jgi:glycosyltransferase involved in cell wall biosynthesis